MNESRPKVYLTLDRRRPKNDGTFPVKLYIYDPATTRSKRYSTTLSFAPEEFKSIWQTTRPRATYLAIREDLRAIISKAEKDLEGIHPFSFEAYEAKLFRPSAEGQNALWHYDERIRSLKELKQIGTASWYKCSKKSLQQFLEHQKDRNIDRLNFDKITPKWLRQYDFFMQESGKSKTTIAMYLRALRAVFVDAIKSGYIDRSQHPFGEGKYELKEGGRVKKALSREELKLLYISEPANPEQQKAKDFWFFSYLCNGMNVKDIINFRYGQIGKDSFVFERIKTKNTNRQSQPIQVFLNEHVRYVIQEYGNQSTGRPNQLVFPILSDTDSAERQHMKTQAFTRFINQHIKKLAMANGITGEISTYFARHSFATGLIRNGKPIAFVQEALGHASSKTTQNYIAGFLNDEKKEAAEATYQDLIS
ncbi:MAG TPA: site-specific integrase [Saprospiraceae bacterium]|nr:site-specific integrase [Saprospiraceae bacterium]